MGEKIWKEDNKVARRGGEAVSAEQTPAHVTNEELAEALDAAPKDDTPSEAWAIELLHRLAAAELARRAPVDVEGEVRRTIKAALRRAPEHVSDLLRWALTSHVERAARLARENGELRAEVAARRVEHEAIRQAYVDVGLQPPEAPEDPVRSLIVWRVALYDDLVATRADLAAARAENERLNAVKDSAERRTAEATEILKRRMAEHDADLAELMATKA